jgi:hypothetical protein
VGYDRDRLAYAGGGKRDIRSGSGAHQPEWVSAAWEEANDEKRDVLLEEGEVDGDVAVREDMEGVCRIVSGRDVEGVGGCA